MKYLLSACAVLLLGLTGCVSGSNYAPLPDIKQNMAVKHPVANVLTPYSGDGFFINTGKITLRVLCFIPTLGLSEIPVGRPRREVIADLKARNRLRFTDENRRYHTQKLVQRMEQIRQSLDPLLGKSKADLIAAMGPPSRTFPDGLEGEVYIYDQREIRGLSVSSQISDQGITHTQGESRTVLKQKLFFLDQSGKLYKWELK